MNGPVDTVCWNFANTIANAGWAGRAPKGVPEWAAEYSDAAASHPDWIRKGEAPAAHLERLVGELTLRLPMSRDEVMAHLEETARHVSFFATASHALAAWVGQVTQICLAIGLPGFAELVVPHHHLERFFATIVTSAEAGSPDPVVLARLGRARLGLDQGLATSLLIDESWRNVADFKAAGGLGYLFEGDAEFATDLRHGVLPEPLSGLFPSS